MQSNPSQTLVSIEPTPSISEGHVQIQGHQNWIVLVQRSLVGNVSGDELFHEELLLRVVDFQQPAARGHPFQADFLELGDTRPEATLFSVRGGNVQAAEDVVAIQWRAPLRQYRSIYWNLCSTYCRKDGEFCVVREGKFIFNY